MNFDLSDEQVAITDAVGQLLAKEIDGTRRVASLSAQTDHDADLWSELLTTGISGIVIPEAFGGSGLQMLEAALVAQELGRAAAAVPYWGHVLACLALVHAGTDAAAGAVAASARVRRGHRHGRAGRGARSLASRPVGASGGPDLVGPQVIRAQR